MKAAQVACLLSLACAVACAQPVVFLQDRLEVSACRGEFESVPVTVLALTDVAGLTVTVSDLRGRAGTMPASAVDVRVVKAWWQAGYEVWDLTHRRLVPELLLKDDALVRVDLDKQANYLRDQTGRYRLCSGATSDNLAGVLPRDAETLQPIDLRKGEQRTFWLTVRVPEQANAGPYRGAVAFSCAGRAKRLPLRVNVRAFDLAPSRLIYSLYYRAHLTSGPPVCNSDDKTGEQYAVEVADMRDHGVLYPANYQGLDGLERALGIRTALGLPAGRFYTLGCNPGSTPEDLGRIAAWMDVLRPWGYSEVYFYGEDEAMGEALRAQKAAWKATQEAGARTFVAGYAGTFEAMGGLLNCAVYFGRPTEQEAAKWHGVGSTVLSYANPQVGVEDPLVYRRNYGLALWRAGFDGAMDYAYQHAFHAVWNDFDDPDYRDHVFAYPTANGVVGTLQWEGFREGVDDVRYIATLQAEVALASPDLAAQGQRFLNRIDPGGDLDHIRSRVVEQIEKLRAARGGGR